MEFYIKDHFYPEIIDHYNYLHHFYYLLKYMILFWSDKTVNYFNDSVPTPHNKSQTIYCYDF